MSDRTTVVGAGIAGLSAALLLSRAGLPTEVYERDPAAPDDPAQAAAHTRPGAPQSRHPHIFLGLFRKQLREHLPDVHDELLRHGAEEVALESPGGGPDQVMIAARRGLVEWALSRALDRDGVPRRHGVTVRALEVADGTVCGLRTDDALHPTQLVVDASGSRSQLARKYTATVADVECGKVYNSRFYQLAEGVPTPPTRYGSVSIVDGLGFGAALFSHDNGSFSVDIGRLPEDEDLKDLRDTASFERVLALFPDFEPWLRPGAGTPVSEVVPMAGLRNVLRALSPDAPQGYVPLGDALCVTDPTFGRGASLALAQAIILARTLAGAEDLPRAAVRATRETEAWLRPWFDDVVTQDTARTTLWRAAVADQPLEAILAQLPPNPFMLLDAAQHDPELADAAGRYVSMLDTTLDTPDLRQRVGRLIPVLMAAQAAAPPPPRSEVLKALAGD
ncbi:NAD(P)/FAD-dependent oxidoreductase [Streptomyces sp. NPDC057806]|uniref:NAD(P)/FAD-dependent oxidoreductase n=1 Tax=Streptomyces sp. NPDC057806 TaxID=3346255 RepID=UPI0036C2A89E